MKKILYATTLTLACLTSIPASLVSSSTQAAAFAAESTCPASNSSSAASGGAIRDQLETVARCNAAKQPSIAVSQQTKTLLPEVQMTNDRTKTSVCPSIFNSPSSGINVQAQLDAIVRCNASS